MELTRSQKVFTMVGTMLGLFLAALDSTIVSTAGPAMQRDLHIAPSLYAWITTSYLVASTVCVPIWGKLSDTFGRKRILVSGVILFLIGSALCGVSQSTLQLLLSRAVQGVGSASLFTSAFAVVADLFPPSERGKYQGFFGAAFGVSSVVGPFVGGFITDSFGWHWVFFINLPVGAIALGFIFARMPALQREGVKKLRLDLAGAAALLLFTVPLLLALSLGRRSVAAGELGWPWASAQILGMFGASVAGLLLFLLIERKAADPLLDLTLFSKRPFAIGNLAAFVVGGTFLGPIVFLPLFMVNVVGLSATNSGLTIMPLTLGIVFGNVLVGQLVSRLGRYKILILGSLAVLCGAFAMIAFTLSPESTQSDVTLRMVFVGLGLGPSIPLFTLAIQNSVPPHQIGVATSTATFSRSMGSTVGLAVLGTVFGAVLASSMQTHLGAVAQELPAQLRSQLLGGPGAEPPKSEEGGPQSKLFDVAAIEETLAQSVGREQAHVIAGKLGSALKQSFSEAIREIHLYTMILALLGLLITLVLPELPLRKGDGPAPAAME